MIQRTFDADRINHLVNHEEIRPHIGGDIEVEIDLSAAVNDRQNIFLNGEHGGFAFTWSAPRVFEVHTFILPDGRGGWSLEFALAARTYMKAHADMLWTRVPPDAENIRKFTMKAGFSHAGQHIIDIGTGPVSYDLYSWRY